MKILIDGNKKFYKACLHTHTICSDGLMTPQEVKNQYLARGYSAVAFTDHEILYDHSDLTDENFVAINGYEYATNNDRSPDPLLRHQSAHFNFIAKDPKNLTQIAYNRDYDWCHTDAQRDEAETRSVMLGYERGHNPADFNMLTALANDNGFLVVYNHPAWSLHTALEKGEFYSSTRPEFHDLRIDGNVLIGRTSPVKSVCVIGPARNKIRINGNTESFEIPLKDGFNDYFRVEITDENGYVATTNAYYDALEEK